MRGTPLPWWEGQGEGDKTRTEITIMTPEWENTKQRNANFIKRYYQFHSKIYDLSRWSFLFGRRAIIQEIHKLRVPTRILEVGCGTGKNLVGLCRAFPEATITGVDLSDAMLDMARKNLGHLNDRVTLLSKAYDQPLQAEQPFELILCSYSLSMFNPGWEEAIEYAFQDLSKGGLIAVVDFHDSRFVWFKRWMKLNHVRLDGHLLPKLQYCFQPKTATIRKAYAGIWDYCLFIGGK